MPSSTAIHSLHSRPCIVAVSCRPSDGPVSSYFAYFKNLDTSSWTQDACLACLTRILFTIHFDPSTRVLCGLEQNSTLPTPEGHLCSAIAPRTYVNSVCIGSTQGNTALSSQQLSRAWPADEHFLIHKAPVIPIRVDALLLQLHPTAVPAVVLQNRTAGMKRCETRQNTKGRHCYVTISAQMPTFEAQTGATTSSDKIVCESAHRQQTQREFEPSSRSKSRVTSTPEPQGVKQHEDKVHSAHAWSALSGFSKSV